MIEDYELKDEFEAGYCDKCVQITNHLADVCQKCKDGDSGLDPVSTPGLSVAGPEVVEGGTKNGGWVVHAKIGYVGEQYEHPPVRIVPEMCQKEGDSYKASIIAGRNNEIVVLLKINGAGF